jgi:hypothetical protein
LAEEIADGLGLFVVLQQAGQQAVALAFANAGRGKMTFDAQLGKQIFHPEVQLLSKLFEGRFDLSLKVSDLSVMQEVAPFLWLLLINSLN